MQVKIQDQPSQILQDETILEYSNFIEEQYIFHLKETLEPPIIASSTDIQAKQRTKPEDIEL